MIECRSKNCKKELMWKQPYHKGDRPVNLDGSKHICSATIFGNLENWKKKWDTVYKFKVPIWCNMCHKHYNMHEVCKHIRHDGFIEGVDTVEFYSDKYSAVKRRLGIRAAKKSAQLDPKGI